MGGFENGHDLSIPGKGHRAESRALHGNESAGLPGIDFPKLVPSIIARHQPAAIGAEGDGRVPLDVTGWQVPNQLSALGIPDLGSRIEPPPCGSCYPTAIGADGDAGEIGMI